VSGVGGGSCLAISGAARRAGDQGRPAQRGRGGRAALCGGPQVQACYAATYRRRPGRRAPSAVARRPQAAADRGTHERDRNPHPPRVARSPSAGLPSPLRPPAKRPAPQATAAPTQAPSAAGAPAATTAIETRIENKMGRKPKQPPALPPRRTAEVLLANRIESNRIRSDGIRTKTYQPTVTVAMVGFSVCSDELKPPTSSYAKPYDSALMLWSCQNLEYEFDGLA